MTELTESTGEQVAEPALVTGHTHDYYAGNKESAKNGATSCQGFQSRQRRETGRGGLIIAMVGLPARGKSFISRKVKIFFRWQNLRTRLFNVGQYRREMTKDEENSNSAEFYSANNEKAMTCRREAAFQALSDALRFIDDAGDVAIYDATNSTNERRKMIMDHVWTHGEQTGRTYRVVWIEVVCDDPEVLNTNIRNKVVHSPDFVGCGFDDAMADFKARIKEYDEVYETIVDDELSYIKLYNMSSRVLANKVYGAIAKSLMPYLMAIHIGTRPIWLVRCAQVVRDAEKDAHLTSSGLDFASKLGAWIHQRVLDFYEGAILESPVKILSSTAPAAVETTLATLALCHASPHMTPLKFKQTALLNAVDRGRNAGNWWIDHCTDKPPWNELQQRDPEFYAKWEANKLRTRFPGGESYHDVMTRVEGCLLEIEASTRPVLCVSHITLLQVLVAYFRGVSLDDSWDISIPLHTVLEITPTLGGLFDFKVVNIDDVCSTDPKQLASPHYSPRHAISRQGSAIFKPEGTPMTEEEIYSAANDAHPLVRKHRSTPEGDLDETQLRKALYAAELLACVKEDAASPRGSFIDKSRIDAEQTTMCSLDDL